MRPTRTLAWLFAIFTIPIGGIFLYLMLGRNRRRNKLFKLKQTPKVLSFTKRALKECSPIPEEEFDEHHKIVSLITKNSHFKPNKAQSILFT